MPVKPLAVLIAAAALGGLPPLARAELSTLFTTPEERQIINSNRYRSDPAPAQNNEPEIESPVQILAREEVTRRYRISGISLSPDGAHTVWVDASAYPDGATLDDGSRVDVETGGEIRVRITAPDGSRHYGLSGESIEFTYLAPIEN